MLFQGTIFKYIKPLAPASILISTTSSMDIAELAPPEPSFDNRATDVANNDEVVDLELQESLTLRQAPLASPAGQNTLEVIETIQVVASSRASATSSVTLPSRDDDLSSILASLNDRLSFGLISFQQSRLILDRDFECHCGTVMIVLTGHLANFGNEINLLEERLHSVRSLVTSHFIVEEDRQALTCLPDKLPTILQEVGSLY